MAKNIVLCSDGTGNRWGAGNQTNVSKLYEAVETAVLPDGTRQVRFYDNGVGTSSNKYIRAVTGAFGFGLRRNVLDLYEFLARHWQPGDRIYLFGFSRGAATVRAFAGMLQECGLLWIDGQEDGDCKCYDEERLDELMDLAKDAYRKRDPGNPEANREHLESFRRSVERSRGGFKLTERVPIRMIGVWDTVSALGFPTGPHGLRWLFAALEWVADKLFPHSFYNYRLDGRVELACHALAIDDERRTFRPMVWNELQPPGPRQVEQVWFPGMHSDVGGGYPRTGLATTALRWMMAQAAQQGLALRAAAWEKASNDANPHGKIHDSRDGASVYYRYLPRDLVRLCEEGIAPKGSGSTREGDEPKVEPGKVKLHRAFMERLHQGTARYAPGLLPSSFLVADDPPFPRPPEPEPSAPDPDASDPQAPSEHAAPADPQVIHAGAAWKDHRDKVLHWTRRRSALYHAFLYVSLLLVIWMLVLWVRAPDRPAGGGPPAEPTVSVPADWASQTTHTVFGWLADPLHWALPVATEPVVTYVFIQKPLWLIALLGLGLTLFQLRTGWFAARDASSQEVRRQVLAGWAEARGRQLHLWAPGSFADVRRLRLGGTLLRLLLIALAVVFTLGAFRISLARSPAFEIAGDSAWMVGLPALAFLVFRALGRLTGHKAGKNPLYVRRKGYDVVGVAAYWSRRALDAERRFLVADLFFPPFYGAAFAASFFIGVRRLGLPSWIGWGLGLLVLVAMIADWVENLLQLHQIRHFEGPPPKKKAAEERPPQGKAPEQVAKKDPVERLDKRLIRIASRATVIKIATLWAAVGAVALLALAALGLAIKAVYF